MNAYNLTSGKIRRKRIFATGDKLEKKLSSSGNAKARQTRTSLRKRVKRKSYHHGSLHEAFLEAAEKVLQREGLIGLTVRGIAREAGVSHAAATHHFLDKRGVLSELAAVGHTRLAETLASHASGMEPGPPKRKALGRGYVAFAVRHPDLFRLMSNGEFLDFERPALQRALRISSRALAGVFDVEAETSTSKFTPLSENQAISLTAGWGFVHGLANLLIDHRLDRLAAGVNPTMNADALVEKVIRYSVFELRKDE